MKPSERTEFELYADIVMPLAQPAYSFAVESGAKLQVGDAVEVQFGRRNIYTGIVWRLHHTPPKVGKIKRVGRRLYDTPLLDERQMRLWEWVADYYMCHIGEVMRIALPSLIKPHGSTPEEFKQGEYRPRSESYICLAERWQDEATLREEMERISHRAKRRVEVLEQLISLIKGCGQADPSTEGGEPFRGELSGEVPRRGVECDASLIAALRKAGYIVQNQRPVLTTEAKPHHFYLPQLSPLQQQTLDSIRAAYDGGSSVHLLHGVTGSGKTEIYMHLIAERLCRGEDVLMLLPEIALTSQLIARMERVFGNRVTAYHSKLSPARRTQSYMQLLNSEGGELIVGARSALFLPLRHLGLVVVDEEHDSSYKQSDNAPRYMGRDVAVMLASIWGAKSLLGSATPSIESYANAQAGKYTYSYLGERYGGSVPPKIIVSDTMRAVKRGERKSHFNHQLLRAIDEALGRGEQVMLFQNRRGFSPFISCGDCGWAMRCPSCNVTLTVHRSRNQMECHYCGYSAPIPHLCPHCQTANLSPMGFGTERVEEAIAEIFPEARVARLDRDSSTTQAAFMRIVEAFERGETDILVGTQMITKGFDFGRVSVVGILNADNLFHSPDFRSSERAFQLMTQVAGRAGRRKEQGVVIIQTAEPDNPIIGWVERGDYRAMAHNEFLERSNFGYPPYSRLVLFTLRDRDMALLRAAADRFAELLREKFGTRVIGAVEPPVSRIRGENILRIILKIESGRSMARARELIREVCVAMRECREWRNLYIAIDVDAQ